MRVCVPDQLRMPVRIVTPSRAMVIVLTATIITVLNVIVNSPSLHSTCNDYYLDKILSGPVEQDDPALLTWVQQKAVPPSTKEYNIDYFLSGLVQEQTVQKSLMFSPSQEFILSKVEEMLGDQIDKGGIFLEAGAYDGEFLSNTLSLEMNHGWRGVLVEAHPDYFEKLLTKNRKAWAINACLNTKPWPSREIFLGTPADSSTNHVLNGRMPHKEMELHTNLASSGLAKVFELSNKTQNGTKFPVQCIPVYTILKALGISHVDFFSLDVERAEMGILESIPWNKISFSIIVIEHPTIDDLREYLRVKGYIHVESYSQDHIFVDKRITFDKKDPAPKQGKSNNIVDSVVEMKNNGKLIGRKSDALQDDDTPNTPDWKPFKKRRSKGIIRH